MLSSPNSSRKVARLALTAFVCAAAAAAAQPDPLPRRGELRVSWRAPAAAKPWAEVTAVAPGGPGASAGLLAGDRIRSIAGRPLRADIDLERETMALREGRAVTLGVERAGKTLTIRATPAPVPREQHPGLEVAYGAVTSEAGHRLRTILTRPAGAPAAVPAVFLAGWLSCDSVETPEATEGFARVLHGIARRSGWALMRVEKPGVGDSEGPPCSETDFRTELAGYRAALRALKKTPGVDPERIVVLGMSNGGGFAPLVGEGERVAGYISSGGWVKTWFEHMMEIERRILTLGGGEPGEVSARMRAKADLYNIYLNGRISPGEVIRRRPELAPAWDDLPGHQYGRPARFYQQLQELNLAAAWAKVDVPVLVVHGEHDWIMTPEDARMITEIVNRKRPGLARLVLIPKMDHFYLVHETPEASFRRSPPGVFAEESLETILGWLKERFPTAP
jgi:pimeloyl-ACP methyl ester carboxylesterase